MTFPSPINTQSTLATKLIPITLMLPHPYNIVNDFTFTKTFVFRGGWYRGCWRGSRAKDLLLTATPIFPRKSFALPLTASPPPIFSLLSKDKSKDKEIFL